MTDILSQIDDQIARASGGGGKGSGLYTLLSLLANQFMGVPRTPLAPEKDKADAPAENPRPLPS